MNLPGIQTSEVIRSNPRMIKTGGGCSLMVFVLLVILLTSCRVHRVIQSAHERVDSISKHDFDQLTEQHTSLAEAYEQLLKESTSTGIVFESSPCPNLDSLKLLLDSAGRANVDRWILQTQKQANTIKILADGSIEATGQIRSYKATTDRLSREVRTRDLIIDSLNHVVDSTRLALSRTADTKVVDVHRSGMAWWWVLVAAGVGLAGGWVLRYRVSG